MTEARSFGIEQYVDYLAFERGLADRTLSAYRRDVAMSDKKKDKTAPTGHDDPNQRERSLIQDPLEQQTVHCGKNRRSHQHRINGPFRAPIG